MNDGIFILHPKPAFEPMQHTNYINKKYNLSVVGTDGAASAASSGDVAGTDWLVDVADFGSALGGCFG